MCAMAHTMPFFVPLAETLGEVPGYAKEVDVADCGVVESKARENRNCIKLFPTGPK